jgi:hypothetical protein
LPIIKPVKVFGIGYGIWGPGKGLTSLLKTTFVIGVYVLLSLLASFTISSINLLACSNLSGVPSTKTFLTLHPITSFFAT